MESAPKPLVSVLIEGYNDSLDRGSALETVRALAQQRYPLDRVEIVLTGSEEQAAHWQAALAGENRFFAVRIIGVEANYYRLKNLAAAAATGEILVFTDSDSLPEQEWLVAIVRAMEGGASVSAGLSRYRWEDGSDSWPALLAAAASISWGFIVPHPGEPARGFLSHNVAFRRSLVEQMPYREDLGRTCAGSFLHDEIVRRGLAITFLADQRARHAFTFGWWLKRLHVRFGYEVFLLRRLNPSSRYGWTQKLWILEPAATAAWHVVLDAPQWLRYSRQLGWSWPRRIVCLPLVMLLSLAARSAEAYGMYSTMLDPERMRRFALSN